MSGRVGRGTGEEHVRASWSMHLPHHPAPHLPACRRCPALPSSCPLPPRPHQHTGMHVTALTAQIRSCCSYPLAHRRTETRRPQGQETRSPVHPCVHPTAPTPLAASLTLRHADAPTLPQPQTPTPDSSTPPDRSPLPSRPASPRAPSNKPCLLSRSARPLHPLSHPPPPPQTRFLGFREGLAWLQLPKAREFVAMDADGRRFELAFVEGE